MNKNSSLWAVGLEIFGQVSTWVIVPIILALVFGKMLDTHFGTKPFIFLALTGLAFIISCVGIVKVVTKYIKGIEEESKKDQKDKEILHTDGNK